MCILKRVIPLLTSLTCLAVSACSFQTVPQFRRKCEPDTSHSQTISLVVDAKGRNIGKMLQPQLFGYKSNAIRSYPSPLTVLDMATSSPSVEDRNIARQYVSNGMIAFRENKIQESIKFFNAAEDAQGSSLSPYLWQRGISYYYNDQFNLSSQQFRADVAVNPNDVEEIVWDIAAQARCATIGGSDSSKLQFPIPNQLSLPPGVRDRRRIMPTVYKLFRGECTEENLAQAGHGDGASSADEFYSLFYLSLFCETVSAESSKAELYMRQAVQTAYYARNAAGGDYMTACARVHCKQRGWTM